jgi:hypothetical protein
MNHKVNLYKFTIGPVFGVAMFVALFDYDASYLIKLSSGIILGLSLVSLVILNHVLREMTKKGNQP